MPVGTLCLGLAIGDRAVRTRALRMFGGRDQMRQMSVITALDWLMIALYFKFNRVFSIRNLDLVGLIALAPALLMIQFGRQHADNLAVEHAGYIWLIVVSGLGVSGLAVHNLTLLNRDT